MNFFYTEYVIETHQTEKEAVSDHAEVFEIKRTADRHLLCQ